MSLRVSPQLVLRGTWDPLLPLPWACCLSPQPFPDSPTHLYLILSCPSTHPHIHTNLPPFPPHPPATYPSTHPPIHPPTHLSTHLLFPPSQGPQTLLCRPGRVFKIMLLLLTPLCHERSVSGRVGSKAGVALLESCLGVEENREDLSCMIRTWGMLGRMGTGLTSGLGAPCADHTQASTCTGRAAMFKEL